MKRILTGAADARAIGAALLVCLVVFSGTACGGSRPERAGSSRAGRPTAIAILWRRRVARLAAGNPLVPTRRLALLRRQLAAATVALGGVVVRLAVRRAPEPAPELVIATTRPARYLKHGLRRLLPLLRGDNSLYLAVVDGHGRLALEWALNGDTNPNHGSLYLRPGLERCSPIVAVGWPSKLPRCVQA